MAEASLSDANGKLCAQASTTCPELSRFLTPPVVADHRNAPVNALGYLRVMFAVDNINETLDRLRKRGEARMESLLLFSRALSSPTMCRFIPALSGVPETVCNLPPVGVSSSP
jgi:hypothetical protein